MKPIHPRHVVIDYAKYQCDDPEAYYGLPKHVEFCSRCVISNQRPNSAVEFAHTRASKKTTINLTDGICDACRVAEAKQTEIDWQERRKALQELCDKHRRSDGRYDCIVPGSGGKDSAYASWVLKHEFGMHPLTVTWAPHLYTDWGWRNFENWIGAGFDNFLHTPNGRTHRLLTRLAVENLFHPFQPFMLGQKSLAPKMALLHNIPLVFYGENEAEYGNPKGDTESAKRGNAFYAIQDRRQAHLGGVSIGDLHDSYGVPEADTLPYLPANPDDLERKGIEVHYLGYYLKWHPQSCYYHAVEHTGFQPSPDRTPGTYSRYNSIDDKIDDFHYWTTFIKFGIGRATYDASQEIRSGDIEREEGLALVHRYDGEFPERFADEIFAYLSIPENEFPVASKMFEQPVMDRDYFLHLADRFRSPHLWAWDGGWKLRHRL